MPGKCIHERNPPNNAGTDAAEMLHQCHTFFLFIFRHFGDAGEQRKLGLAMQTGRRLHISSGSNRSTRFCLLITDYAALFVQKHRSRESPAELAVLYLLGSDEVRVHESSQLIAQASTMV